MHQYLQQLNPIVREYFGILVGGIENIPDFLFEYSNTPEMQRIGKIGCACGCDYTDLFHMKFFYSNLEHSFGTALIVWNFTHDKKQTLAGLFHDIATPVFKHAIDFMNGDHEKQESTEELTTQMIQESKEITVLLKRDGIKIEEVDDYHQYPIADNDTPKLSADRLEYTFMNGIYFKEIWNLEEIKKIYQNIEVQINEENVPELGFKDLEIAEIFIQKASILWPLWISNEDKLTMQFIADVIKKMSQHQLLSKKDLYTLSEAEVIERICNTKEDNIGECFKRFEKAITIGESDEPVEDKYCISVKGKRRYIVPLVKTDTGVQRIDKLSEDSNKKIQEYLQGNTKKYAYLDFNL